MVLGLSVGTFTVIHVIISLIGIVTGLVALLGMLGGKRLGDGCSQKRRMVFRILTNAGSRGPNTIPGLTIDNGTDEARRSAARSPANLLRP